MQKINKPINKSKPLRKKANVDTETLEAIKNIDKRKKNQWNFVVGSQFQINKSYMIRAEYGFLSARQHFLCSLQYRFAL